MTDRPDLPPRFQNAFEAAKAEAELAFATFPERLLPNLSIVGAATNRLKLVTGVFFAYCTQARNACQEGDWTVRQASEAIDAAWISTFDSYFGREYPATSRDVKSGHRLQVWQSVKLDSRWRQHLTELAALAEDSAAALKLRAEASSRAVEGGFLKADKPGESGSSGTEPAPEQPVKEANGADGGGADWQDIEVSFLSDERVQIRNGARSESRNYAELGFGDGRNGKPNQAWVTLRVMAQENGIIRDGAKTGAAWPKVEKRIQEIRKVLRRHFSITADPIPFVEGTGYQACFRIGCGPSFHT